jgi:hypothetical protein
MPSTRIGRREKLRPASSDEKRGTGECRGIDLYGGLARCGDRARTPTRAAVLATEQRTLGSREDAPGVRRIEDRVDEEPRTAAVARRDRFFGVEQVEVGERPGESSVAAGKHAAARPDGSDEQHARIDGADEHPLDFDVVVHRGEDPEARVLELEWKRRGARRGRRRGKCVDAGTAGDYRSGAYALQSE